MKKVVTAKQMRDCDLKAISSLNITSIDLMERASEAVKEEFLKIYEKGSIAVICGGGNNGGDGAGVARLLNDMGIKCDVYFFYEKIGEDCKKNLNALQNSSLKILYNEKNYDFNGYDYIIDALFGTGLNRQLNDDYIKIIDNINSSKAFVLSIDVPSGLDSDCFTNNGAIVKADCTVSFMAYKYGQLFNRLDFCGKIIIKDIGIAVDCGAEVFEKKDIKEFFPKRKKDSHKGSYGKLCIIAGSGKYFGAGLISYNAASSLRAGAGLTTIAIPSFLAVSYRKHIKECVLEYLNDNGENAVFNLDIINKIMESNDAISIGMGMGKTEETYKFTEVLIKQYDKKLLLDADALNAVSLYNKDFFKEKHACDVVITPHLMEFSRLTGLAIAKIKSNPIYYARQYAKENNVTVLLKGAVTIICNATKTVLNITGCPAMAKAGSGDVLSGIIGGLMAQGHCAFDSAVAGAYIHGKAGEIAGGKLGEYSVLASDICDNIAYAVKSLDDN